MALPPDPRLLPAAALLQALNHLLAGQPWLRDRLLPHAGRSVRLDVFPARLHLRITADGLAALDAAAADPDAVIRMSPLNAARLLAGDDSVRPTVDMSGDTALAGVVAGVLRQLRWDYEEDLSRVVGDIPARRFAAIIEDLARWRRSAAAALAGNAAEYLGEESGLLARRDDVARWSREVDALRDDVERLEKRAARRLARRPPAA